MATLSGHRAIRILQKGHDGRNEGPGEAQRPLRAMRTKARDGFINALRNAHCWLDELLLDPTRTIESLAVREGIVLLYGDLIVHTSPTKRSSDFVAHLEQLDRLLGPRPGQPAKPVVLVEDNGPIHTSKLSMAALAARRSHWLTVEWLPKYAPELNDIEVVWRDLKAHHLAHQTFADIGRRVSFRPTCGCVRKIPVQNFSLSTTK